RQLLGDAITYQVLKDSHILVYPIPGGVLGDRLVNFVWYVNVAEGAELEELRTARRGHGEGSDRRAAGRRGRAGPAHHGGRDRRGRAVRPGRLRHRRPPHGV